MRCGNSFKKEKPMSHMRRLTDDWATIVDITLSVSVLAFALAVLVFVVVW